MNEIAVGTQVVHKQRMLHGNASRVRIGDVIALGEGTATVSFPPTPGNQAKKEVLPLASLTTVQAQFGRTRVQVDPIRRSIATTRFR